MNSLANLKTLFYLIAMYILIAIISVQKIRLQDSFEIEGFTEEMSKEDRNENSTPRSFILPATPAIAHEQEKSNNELDNDDIACLAALHILGYDVGRDGASSNARFFASLFNYQKKNNLKLTGRLSIETKEHLGCYKP